ncbi:chalcone isomerase-like protein [Pseudoduganella lurida]|uniref:Chalcone isomerase-like protein n=1 Tax=Pseudoduganella lurida TaxID=1036180 RepID=A0A562R0F2_9BURK|nr:chalcone isomerase family protein [Pseudoduganella lurida]TWI61920.1 chalcone isomerase-like protein [Pseudoduganella lurida]
MNATRRTLIHGACALLLAASLPALAATTVADVRFDDTATVQGQALKLNGAGLRTKVIFKVYALGLYLPEKKTTASDILATQGARRVQIVTLRDLSSEDFGDAFMKGLNANTDQAERTRLLSQTKTFGEMFASIPGLKKGDVLLVDWIPGTGTVCTLNGKQIGQTVPELAFYNAILRIWIGDKPADTDLKPKLLGG